MIPAYSAQKRSHLPPAEGPGSGPLPRAVPIEHKQGHSSTGVTPLTSAVFEHPRVSLAHSKSHLWDQSLLPRVPECLGRGCQGWHGGRGHRHGSGNHRAPCFVVSSPAANCLADPALRICFGRGDTGESHQENSTWGSSTSGQVSGAAVHLFFFFFLPLPSLLLLTFLFLFQTEVSETPSPVLLRKEGSPRALRVRCAARPSRHEHRSPPSARGTCPHLQSCGR